MLYHLLYPVHEAIGVFRVFRYITFRTFAAILTALFICFILGPYLINLLSNKQIGQVVRDDGPESHLKKSGTPTMGGVLILIAVLTSTLLWARFDNPFLWLVLVVLLGMGSIGFVDDFIKLIQRNPKGLSGRQKLLFQTLVASIASLLVFTGGSFTELPSLTSFDTQIYFPFLKGFVVNLGWMFPLWIIFIIVGSSNAVNLTDGLDGLAIGPILTAALTFLLLAYISGHARFADYLNLAYIPHAGELAIVCGALFGAGLGFLWYNTYPAQVFMGDVGSLAMGGLLGIVAIVIKQEILWALVGGIFVIETLSVIAQVVSFKLIGKRIFRMAPIHHHFELKGWAEPKVIVRFWIISIILSLLALTSLKLR